MRGGYGRAVSDTAATVSRLLPELRAIANQPTPTDLGAALQALPAVGVLPSPWDVWTLIGLVRHQARQNWVLSVVRERLHCDPSRLARMGAGGHPKALPQDGEVPGLPGWSYMFHGRGCCLEHKQSGEAIDVDFADDTAEHFDTYFYIGYVASLRDPDVPEARLRALFPDPELLVLSIEDLQATDALLRGSHRVYFRLAPALQATADAIEEISRGLADPSRRVWLAARLGDFVWARELATDPSLRAELDARAEQCLALRRRRVEQALADDSDHTVQLGLMGLAALAAPGLGARLRAALAQPSSGTVSTALKLLNQHWHDEHAAAVLALLERVGPRGSTPQPYIFSTCAAMLLTHGFHVEVVLARLAEAGDRAGAELLAQAIAHRSPTALGLARQGLRSHIPMYRAETAALLAALDRPGPRRELLAVLAESDDLLATCECRAALRRSRDPAARAALDAWEQRHPYVAPTEPPYTFLDIQLAQADEQLARLIDDQAGLLERYRLVGPDRSRGA